MLWQNSGVSLTEYTQEDYLRLCNERGIFLGTYDPAKVSGLWSGGAQPGGATLLLRGRQSRQDHARVQGRQMAHNRELSGIMEVV
jgi:hypothetical protein